MVSLLWQLTAPSYYLTLASLSLLQFSVLLTALSNFAATANRTPALEALAPGALSRALQLERGSPHMPNGPPLLVRQLLTRPHPHPSLRPPKTTSRQGAAAHAGGHVGPRVQVPAERHAGDPRRSAAGVHRRGAALSRGAGALGGAPSRRGPTARQRRCCPAAPGGPPRGTRRRVTRPRGTRRRRCEWTASSGGRGSSAHA